MFYNQYLIGIFLISSIHEENMNSYFFLPEYYSFLTLLFLKVKYSDLNTVTLGEWGDNDQSVTEPVFFAVIFFTIQCTNFLTYPAYYYIRLPTLLTNPKSSVAVKVKS